MAKPTRNARTSSKRATAKRSQGTIVDGRNSALPTKAAKTGTTATSLSAFLASLDDATRAECVRIDAWMHEATGVAAVMYGRGIVGYGTKVIRYAGGREAPWIRMGFSARQQGLVLYGLVGETPTALLQQLGRHTTGKGCLYIRRLSDVEPPILRQIIQQAAQR